MKQENSCGSQVGPFKWHPAITNHHGYKEETLQSEQRNFMAKNRLYYVSEV